MRTTKPAMDEGEEEAPGFLAGGRGWILVAVLALAGGGLFWKLHKSGPSAPPRQERMVMISLPPPPPPPPKPTPPPLQPPPPQDQKVPDKKDVMDDAPKPDAPKPEPVKADEPPPSMGSNIKGDGSDGFGLSGSGNGGFVGIGGKGSGGGSPYGRYASQVKSRIADTLRQDKRTRAAAFDLKLKLWIDDTGKVTRAEPAGADSIGAAAMLVGLRLADRPPAGMPMPLLASLSARRP